MIEKRRARRLPVRMELNISSLFKQDNVNVELDNASIEVVDISKLGIGFVSKSVLPLEYYFNTKIYLGDADAALYCVVKILRRHELGDGLTRYGCEFVGFPSVLNYIIEEYEEKYCSDTEK